MITNDKSYYQNQGIGHTNESDGWFEIDFNDKKINLTSYALKTSSSSSYSFPKSWRIVGSNNKEEWEILSHQINNSDLNGKNKIKRFDCEENNKFYRFIRFLQDDSWGDSYQYNIVLAQIEFFGTILKSD